MADTPKKPLTGRHVLMWITGFFGVMIVVNAVFVYFAVTSFRGEDVPRSYRQGLEYNQTIAERQKQGELGWQARYNVIKDAKGLTRLMIAITDKDGAVPIGLEITGTLRHPTDTDKDRTVTFSHLTGGRYQADDPVPQGQWRLMARAKTDLTEFNFEQDLWVP